MKLDVINSKKKGVYKNNLLTANSDRIEFDSIWTQTDNNSFYLEFEVTDNSGSSFTYLTNNAGTDTYIGLGTDMKLKTNINGVFQGHGSFGVTGLGVHNILIERESGANYISLYGLSRVSITESSAFNVETIGRQVAHTNFKALNYYYGSTVVDLNEASGVNVYDSNRNKVAERMTAHADGTIYITNTMIERYG